jgi:hypothetical protein
VASASSTGFGSAIQGLHGYNFGVLSARQEGGDVVMANSNIPADKANQRHNRESAGAGRDAGERNSEEAAQLSRAFTALTNTSTTGRTTFIQRPPRCPAMDAPNRGPICRLTTLSSSFTELGHDASRSPRHQGIPQHRKRESAMTDAVVILSKSWREYLLGLVVLMLNASAAWAKTKVTNQH